MVDSSEVQISLNDVMHILQCYYREFNFSKIEIENYNLRPFSNEIQGFLSNHRFLSVLVKYESEKGVVEDEISFFTKLAPVYSKALSQYVEDFNVFEKEALIYRLLLPRLQGINKRVGFIAMCYLAKNNFLVFENLSENQFRSGTTSGCILDYDHLRVALRSLASMHSASIVLENRVKKNLLDLYPKCLQENSYPDNVDNLRVRYVKITIKTLCSLVPLVPKYSKLASLKQIVDKFDEILNKIFVFVKPSNEFRNVASHGDLWGNNLLFRYDGKSGNPVECRLVDFQLARYAPPMMDVTTLLTITTTSSFRQTNLNSLLKEYYDFLKDLLAKHGIDVQNEISKKQYEESVEYYKLAGLIESCLFSHITLLPPKTASSLCQNSDNFQKFLSQERINICMEAFQTDDIYRDRLSEMICEIIDNYALNDITDQILL